MKDTLNEYDAKFIVVYGTYTVIQIQHVVKCKPETAGTDCGRKSSTTCTKTENGFLVLNNIN